ncbi:MULTISPECIES: VCBS repeat-containing protein [unclassified Amycolatopsis]|uniref:FG-GAP repeat domain-containing protein n=1 Tax=unclassified Amycolatopsis TaxID=2618356 RepID=UPI002876E320|nr:MULTISPECIES: VCBS repeat-containing protein [unclassified Amycolatopsis]MDS0136667.1 VCBS repeat-containing protein [Amycolatopsis sp. 505]MDS0143331.1 VCBS repeat-containing protein [Amycolatopsis sp. CM201R]
MTNKTIARLTVTFATAALTAVSIAVPGTAHASAVNGPISRGEVLDRAQYWVDQGYTYTQTGTHVPGPDGGQTYRRDCSGLVSMTWHLNTSLITNEFLSRAQNGNGMHVVARDDLRPGDAMVRDSDGSGPDGHMELFAFWKNQGDHSQGAYVYSFNSTGQTVQNPYKVNNNGNLGFDSWSEVASYTAIRYDRIVDQSSGANGVAAGDVTGDGRADLVARKPDGTLWLYANGGSNTAPYSTGSLIGTGWQGFGWFLVGDVTGDGKADIVAAKSDGTLWLYTHGGDNTSPYSTGTLIGSAWQQFSHVTLADVTGDGRADLVAARPDGTLWLYTNGGNNTSPYSTGSQIGVGWEQFSWILGGDVTGDHRADIVAAKPDGTLWLYVNGGSDTAPYSTGTQIGVGWAQFDRIQVGDVTGDHRADITASRPDGTLLLYTNGGSDTAPYSTGSQIGSGWQTFA